MRCAVFIFGLFCVSAVPLPQARSAAAETNKRAGVVAKSDAVVPLPRTAPNTPPRSATHARTAAVDPHPLLTEFFGPARKAPKPAMPSQIAPTDGDAAKSSPSVSPAD